MAVFAPRAQTMTRGQPRSLQTEVMPAPLNGIDGRFGLASQRASDCIYAYNIGPEEFGLRTREGYREWATNLETAPGLGLGVRTLVPYRALSGEGADKLFAVTNEGIWDVTTSTAAPTRVFTFTDTSAEAGWGHYTHFTTDAAETVLFYADSKNGLLQYDTGTDTWALATGITDVDVTKVVFVVAHKQRIWVIEDGSTQAWYLPIGSIAGVAEPFAFGSKFKHGAELLGLYTWTLDSGDGVDDILVAVSRSGDVLPYQGSDPGQQDWNLIGTFYVGEMPLGRRVAEEVGGDMHIISDRGVTSLNDLLRGVSGVGNEDSIANKITRFVREDMKDLRNLRGWEIQHYPNEGTLLINTPLRPSQRYFQYRFNTTVLGWSFWRDVPALTFDVYQSRLMAGTLDNRVLRMDVNADKIPLDGSTPGEPIEFSLLTNFFHLNAPAQFKWGEVIRTDLLAQARPSVTTKFLYDYKIDETRCIGVPDQIGDLWDVGVWDVAVWGGGQATGFAKTQGSWGMGRTMAVAMCGQTYTRATLASFDIMWRVGARSF